MDAPVEIAIIGMIGSVLRAVASAAAVYLGAKNRWSLEDHAVALNSVEAKVDGQLTEVIGLRDAVAFGKGEPSLAPRGEGGGSRAGGGYAQPVSVVAALGPTRE